MIVSRTHKNRNDRKRAERHKTYFYSCAPSEDSDQPARSRSLIRIFTGLIVDNQARNDFFFQVDNEVSDQTAVCDAVLCLRL